ncbi:hypothetical protein H4218_003397 [Coemansia sp. IMI 209128]|nr:hypothetical protein H4218_003397 [Coemansia sp. IMI 209128]
MVSPQPKPPYLFNIVGDEVSVFMLPGSTVVSKWREPPFQVPTLAQESTPAPRMQSPLLGKPILEELSPLARQHIGFIAIETSAVSARTSSILPASPEFPVVPWVGPVIPSSVPHPLTITPDALPSSASGMQATPTHSADSSNSSRSNSVKDRLADGYIVLISVAAVFVLAALFYFFTRYLKYRKAASGSRSPSLPGSRTSGSPSVSVAVEQKRQVSTSRTKFIMPDSGTGINFQQKSIRSPDAKSGRTLEANTMSVHQPPSALFRSLSHGSHAAHRYPDLQEQDRFADRALRDRYMNYRHPGSMGNGRAVVRQKSHSMSRHRIPSFQGYTADRPRELHTRSATAEHAVHPIGQFRMPPPPPPPLSRPFQDQAQPETQTSGVGQHHCERPNQMADSPSYAQEPANQLPTGCVDLKDKSALLDTSSANPSLTSKMGSSPRTRTKARKLVRDSTKRPLLSMSAKTERKLPPASPKTLAKPDEQEAGSVNEETKTPEQSKSNHSMSLRTRLWSSVHSTKKGKEADEAVDVHSSALKIVHDAPDEPEKLSPLMNSIESFSESYQFAIRHRPPLGPLRVVEPHAPALPDELAIMRGHSMFVIGEFADGWVLAINASTNNECGMVPRRCLFFPTAPFMTKEAIAASMSPSGAAKTLPHVEI